MCCALHGHVCDVIAALQKRLNADRTVQTVEELRTYVQEHHISALLPLLGQPDPRNSTFRFVGTDVIDEHTPMVISDLTGVVGVDSDNRLNVTVVWGTLHWLYGPQRRGDLQCFKAEMPGNPYTLQ